MSHPLHRHPETHLYDGNFSDLATDQLTPGDDVLLAAPDNDRLDELQTAILEENLIGSDQLEIYSGDQSSVPFETDTFDVAIQYNPGRGVLQRHLPLYKMTRVVRQNGHIIYRAPNYLAHSKAVTVDTLFALGWRDHQDPSVAGILTVTAPGDPSNSHESPSLGTTQTLDSFTP